MSDRRASEKAETQHGVISRPQALAVGLSTTQIQARLRSGRWALSERGTYRVVGAPKTWRRELAIAQEAAGEESAVSHRAAAELHGLSEFGQVVEVTTPRTRRFRSTLDSLVHRHRDLVEADVTEVDGLRVTTVERTLLDLGAVVGHRRVEHCLDAAVRDDKTTLGRTTALLAMRRKRGRRGAGVLARVLDGRSESPVPESRYEREFLTIIAELGLQVPVPQHKVRDHSGTIIARVDFAWLDRRLIVEIDGHRYHATREQRARDATRQNILTNLGWSVLRFTTDNVFTRDPQMLRALRIALA